VNVIEHLTATMAAYQAIYGEPQYRYFRKYVAWTKERRKPGYHIKPIGDGEEVSKEDYETQIEFSKKLETDAFMGKWQQGYWLYHRKIVTDGWREHLLKDLDAVAVTNGDRE
jgi:hypothetical protein